VEADNTRAWPPKPLKGPLDTDEAKYDECLSCQ
jgi:hypothetical protein